MDAGGSDSGANAISWQSGMAQWTRRSRACNQ